MTMSAIRAKNTKPELQLRSELWARGIKGYRLHWKKAPGKPDISFPGRKIAIFVNGCFWHRCSKCEPSMPKSHSHFWEQKFRKNIERDKSKVDVLKQQAWKVLIFWECELKKDLDGCTERISKLLSLKK
jgi:DNA mismatch endonuclease (patch repair protein)